MASSPGTATVGVGSPGTVGFTANYATIYITSDTTAWNYLNIGLSNVIFATMSPSIFSPMGISPVGHIQGTIVSGGTYTMGLSNGTGTLTATVSAATVLTIYVYKTNASTGTITVSGG